MVTEVEIELPLGWPGTRPEFLVYRALEGLGYKAGLDFDYQSSQQGGRSERGGSILDFYIPSLNLGINVQSVYWHYGRPEQVMRDEFQRESLEAQGIRVVYLDENDILRNARFYVQQALQGNDFSRMTR